MAEDPLLNMISLLNCFLLLSFITVENVTNFTVKINPLTMISSGMTYSNIFEIMRGLLVTQQYKALLEMLKYPSYDLSVPYQSACEYLNTDMVKDILNNFEIDDQVILLSENCVCKSFHFWTKIKTEEIALLPVSPMANRKFSPIIVEPLKFLEILKHALSIYSNPKTRPIDFYSWLRNSRIKAANYFSSIPTISLLIPNFMNGIMFFVAEFAHQSWLLNLFDSRINDLINFKSSVKFDHFWIELLKIFIVLKSIYNAILVYKYSSPIDPLPRIIKSIKTITSFCEDYFTLNKIDELASKVIKIITNMNVRSKNPTTLAEVIKIFLGSKEEIHPDWIVGLLMCKLPSKPEDLYHILLYVSEKNPHYHTLEIISNLMVQDLNFNTFKDCKSLFKKELLLENPEMTVLRPLSRKFRDLRTKMLPFPRIIRHELIAGLLDAPREPQELFRDIVNDFHEKYSVYLKDMTSVMTTSFTRTGSVKLVNTMTFISKALKAFLNVPEFYTITSISKDNRVIIVPNPFLPAKYIKILTALIVHASLLGRRVPFKFDKEYFMQSLKADSDKLSDIYNSNSSELEFMFVKISHVLNSVSWYENSNYMNLILEVYHDINLLSDFLVRIIDTPKPAIDWLHQNFIEGASAVRTAVRNVFCFYHFNSTEIYYILFDK